MVLFLISICAVSANDSNDTSVITNDDLDYSLDDSNSFVSHDDENDVSNQKFDSKDEIKEEMNVTVIVGNSENSFENDILGKSEDMDLLSTAEVRLATVGTIKIHIEQGDGSHQDLTWTGVANGYTSYATSHTDTKNDRGNWQHSADLTFTGVFKPDNSYSITITSNPSGHTYTKSFRVTSKSSISIGTTAVSNYNYGSSTSNKVVFSGQFSGKKGQAPLAKTGGALIYRNGAQVGSVDVDDEGRWSYSISTTSLNPGDYTFTVGYAGNDYYEDLSAAGSKTLTVSKNTPTIGSATAGSNYYYGASTSDILIYSGQFSGKVNSVSMAKTGGAIIFADNNQIGTTDVDADGKWTFNAPSTTLSTGDHTLTVKYAGNSYYNSIDTAGNSKTITVYKNDLTIGNASSSDIHYGEGSDVLVYSGQFAGKVNSVSMAKTAGAIIYRNGTQIATVNVDGDGKWSYSISSTSLARGSYEFSVGYSGNDYYNSISRGNSKIVNILKGDYIPSFTYTITNSSYPGSISITVYVKNGENTPMVGVLVTPSGTSFVGDAKTTDGEGKVIYNVGNLNPGSYSDWKFVTDSNDDYDAGSIDFDTFTIDKQVPTIIYSVTGTEFSPAYKTVTVTVSDRDGNPLNGFNVSLSGKDVNVDSLITDANGQAVFNVTNLTYGSYSDWLITTGETEYYASGTSSISPQGIVPGDSFTALNYLITNFNGNVLNLTHNYQYYTQYDSVFLGSGVIISETININGNGYVLDAKKKTRILRINAANVVLNNLRFTNGYAAGGALEARGNNLIVNNSYFYNNEASVNGGAVYVTGSNIKILNSQFSNNKVTSKSAYGGAIRWDGSNGLLDNCKFTSNNGNYGAGIYWTGSGGIVNNSVFTSNKGMWGGAFNTANGGNLLKILNSNFTSNVATYGGGGININGKTMVDGCIFISNKQTSYTKRVYCGGGAIRIVPADCIVQNSVFTNNAAATNSGEDYVGGGGIQWYGARGILNSSKFTGNTAKFYGGAVHWVGSNGIVDMCDFTKNRAYASASRGGAGAIKIAGGGLKFYRSNFTSNSAAKYGGAIEASASSTFYGCTFTSNSGKWGGGIAVWSTIKIYDSKFISNSVSQQGAALYWKGGNGVVDNTLFSKNSAPHGGAIFWIGSNGLVNNSVFNNNKASSNGGGLKATGSSFKLYNSNFTSNNAKYGGAFEVTGGNSIVSGSVFTSNTATWGAAVSAQASGLKVLKSKFFDNVASNGGAGVNCDKTSVTVDECYFEGNKAKGASYGGSSVRFTQASCVLSNSNFVDNYAEGFGGAVVIRGDSNKVLNSNFTRNKANKNYAGAVYILGKNGVVDNCKFDDNTAVFAGAVGFLGTGNTIKNSNFTNNTAKDYAGAVYLIDSNKLESSIFVNNSAINYGGSVYVKGNNVEILKSLFNQSNAIAGGAIYLFSGNNIKVLESKFDNNSANLAGAIYMHSNNAIVNNSVFNYNSAIDEAGAIYMAVKSSINNSNFTLNKASNYGGAIYVDAEGSTIVGSNYNNNSAPAGASIYIKSNTVSVDNSIFVNHKAVNGSAIYWKGDSGSLTNSILDNNTASSYGAAVYVFGKDLDLKLSNFTANNAKFGGAVYVVGENANLISLNFNNNSAILGGAVYTRNQNSTITSTNFTNNSADYGAGIFVLNNVTLNPSIFTNNNAKFQGGAGYSYDFIHHAGTTLTYFNPEIHRDDFYAAFVKLVNDTIYVGEYAYLEVNSTTYRSLGNVLLEIDGVNYTGVWMNDTWLRVNTTGLKWGIYEPIYGIFNSTDDEYKGYRAVLSLTVKRLPVNLTLLTNETGINGNISVRVNETNATGNITVRFNNGFKYSGEIVNGTAVITLDEHILGGLYNITLLYNGDEIYDEYENKSSLKINKVVYIPSLADNWTYVGGEVIVILPDDAVRFGGNVSFEINGRVFSTMVYSDNIVFTLGDDIPANVYNVRIWYSENGKYNESVNLTTFEIVKYPTNITLDDDEIEYGGNITFRVDSNFTDMGGLINGTISFVIDGHTYSGILIHDEDDTNMYVVIDVSTLPAKVYENVTVTFTSTNSKYADRIQNFTFKISKLSSSIEIDNRINGTFNTTAPFVDFIVYNPSNITLIVYDSQGNVVYNNTDYESFAFSIFNLTAGIYNLTIYNADNENFTGSFNSTLFEVYKISSGIVINQVINGTYNTTDVIVDFTVDNRTSVNVTITNSTGDIVYNGTFDGIQFIIGNLSAGIYNITITNVGTESIYGSNATTLFEVYKAKSFVNITEIINGYYNTTNVEVNYAVVNLTSVKVIIKRNGTNVVVYEGNIVGNFTIKTLAAGVYNITVVNTESQNYTMHNASALFEVYKVGSIVNITEVINGTYNTSDISVKFTVTNKTDVTILITKNGTGEVITLDNFDEFEYVSRQLAAGLYNITIINNENENFTAFNTSSLFEVLKAGSNVVITNIVNSTFNTTDVIVSFDVTNRTGIVIVVRDGEGNIVYENNTFTLNEFTIRSLNAGVYNITIFNAESDNYTGFNASGLFEVIKATSNVGILEIIPGIFNTTDAIVKFDVTNRTQISIVVYNNATGTVEYENNNFAGNVFSIDYLSAGVYNITISNAESKNYNASNTSALFVVNKATSFINITEIIYGVLNTTNATIKFNVINSTNVRIIITNSTNATVLNNSGYGLNNVTLDNLTLGIYNITIINEDDNNYIGYNTSALFKVVVPISIIATDISRGYNSPYDYVAVFTDEFGNPLNNTQVQITAEGKVYNLTTNENGEAYLTQTTLDVGLHNISLYNPVTQESRNYNANIVERLQENTDVVMDFSDGSYYKVRAFGDDAQPIGGVTVVISVNGVDYNVVTDANGYASLKIRLSPKTYEITANWNGFKVNKVVVKQILKAKSLKIKKSAKKLKYKATLKWSNGTAISGKTIVFKFKGKTYKAVTNKKGIAKIKLNKKVLSKLKAGKKYKMKITYNYVDSGYTAADTIMKKIKVKR